MTLRQLPENLINQIAAGEVIERPASALKELVENSIDAKAKHIEITLHNGGKSLLTVTDDGVGISKQDIPIAIKRHTTSKLPENNLNKINYLGFRGEAISSIAAVSRLTIKSHPRNNDHGDNDHGWELKIEEGKITKNLRPTHMKKGTIIKMEDLFFATPARLKFLRADTTEMHASLAILRALALAHPDKTFRLFDQKRQRLNLSATDHLETRIGSIMPDDFIKNAIPFDTKTEDISISGYLGLPNFQKSNQLSQFFFVNQRYVKDRLIFSGIRAAYSDLIPSGRFPCLVLYIKAPPDEIDINVHPSKTEIRFLFPQRIRSQIIGAIHATLREKSHKIAAPILSSKLAERIVQETVQENDPYVLREESENTYLAKKINPGSYKPSHYGKPFITPSAALHQPLSTTPHQQQPIISDEKYEHENFPLGAACAQIHQNYIITQTKDGIAIIDQHAAHERIVYEEMKQSLNKKENIPSQSLLIPEIIKLSEEICQKLLDERELLKKLGLVFDAFGDDSLIIHESPAILGKINASELMQELAETLETESHSEKINNHFYHICATMACYGSIRSGRRVNAEEMNILLRQIENTPFSSQCNHGRPTYITLSLKDIEKLFSRR